MTRLPEATSKRSERLAVILRWLLIRTAMQRLARDRSFTLSTLSSLSVAGVLCALTGAWLWNQLTVQPPYRSIESLWFVQIISSDEAWDDYGSEMQASIKALARLAERQDLFAELLLARTESTLVIPAHNNNPLNGEGVGTLLHGPALHRVLGTDVARGTLPRADHYEIAISHAFALRHFGSVQAAIGKTIETSETALTVTGVLGEDFVAPSLLGPQRAEYGAIDLYRPTTQLFQAPIQSVQDRSEQWLVVGRSDQDLELVQRRLETLLSEVAAETGRWNLDVEVRPLRAHMLGNAPVTATVLLTAALVLAASTIFGILLLAAARFAERSAHADALRASGATPLGEWAFERYEALLVAGLSGAAGLALMIVVLPILNLTTVAHGIVDTQFALRGSLVIVAWTALLALILVLGAAAVAPADNPWMLRAQLLLGLSRKGLHGPLQRILQGLQVLVALAAMTLLLMMLDTARATLAAAAGLDYSGLVQWELVYPAGTRDDVMREDLERIRAAARSHPGVGIATISLASALDLLSDHIASFSGHRPTGNEIVREVQSDGSFILQSDSDPSAESSMLRYWLFVAPVEPEFFSILGYRVTQGRTFSAADSDVAVLTPAASRALFANPKNVVDELIPDYPRIDGRQDVKSMWHGGVRVIGEVEDRRIHHALAGLAPLLQSPVAFVPYTGPKIEADRTILSHGYVLLALRPGHDAPDQLLERHLQSSLVPGLQATATVLEDAKNRRLRQHLIGSLGILAIGLLVISSAALSAWGSGRLSAHGRRQEIAIRLALGADELRLIRRVVAREMTGPLVLALVWIVLVAVIETIGRVIGQSEFVSISDGLIAAFVVLLAVVLGTLAGVREPVLKPPMEVLRTE